jgi:hypothetical protein
MNFSFKFCTNKLIRHIAMLTKFYTIMSNICRCLRWNFLYVTLLESSILRWVLDLLEIFCPQLYVCFSLHRNYWDIGVTVLSVKLGLSQYERYVGWECLRKSTWEGYLSLNWVATQQVVGDNVMRGLWFFPLSKYCLADQIKRTRAWTCGTYVQMVKYSLFTLWNYIGAVEVYLHSFLTSKQDECKWLTSSLGRSTLTVRSSVSGWVSEPVWKFWEGRKSFAPTGIRSRTVHPVAYSVYRLRYSGSMTPVGENINVCRILVGKSEGKRSLVRPRHRWEDKLDHMEISLDVMNWIDLARDGEK